MIGIFNELRSICGTAAMIPNCMSYHLATSHRTKGQGTVKSVYQKQCYLYAQYQICYCRERDELAICKCPSNILILHQTIFCFSAFLNDA